MSLLKLKYQKYKNPNKYIIKHNKFVRDFDKLYKNINDPWDQKKNFEFSEQFVFCISGLLNRINKNKKKISVLDVGAGSGILKKYLNKNFKYTGTDIYKNKSKNVIFDDIRVLNNSFINKYDLIFCLKTIYYVSDDIKIVLHNFRKYLKKNGLLIISYNLKKNSYSNKFLTDLKLKNLLDNNFKELFTLEINREKYLKKDGEKVSIFIFSK
tara:strand:- start:92 stop:724 length:633 start_codon:yes stop_codon:yes gene_type:complete